MTERIVIDWENNAQEWWDAASDQARNAPHLVPPKLVRLLDGTPNPPDEMILTGYEAIEIARWAASLPGWDTGPEHAPNPILFQDVDPDG